MNFHISEINGRNESERKEVTESLRTKKKLSKDWKENILNIRDIKFR